MWYIGLYYFILAAVIVAALASGELAELIGGLAVLVADVFTIFFVGVTGWRTAQWDELAIDLSLMGVLWFVGIRYRRWWPAVAAAFVLFSALSAVARWLDPTFDQVAYSIMAGISSYPVLMVLMVAVTRHQRPRGANLFAK